MVLELLSDVLDGRSGQGRRRLVRNGDQHPSTPLKSDRQGLWFDLNSAVRGPTASTIPGCILGLPADLERDDKPSGRIK
jgi:hypothetical protein